MAFRCAKLSEQVFGGKSNEGGPYMKIARRVFIVVCCLSLSAQLTAKGNKISCDDLFSNKNFKYIVFKGVQSIPRKCLDALDAKFKISGDCLGGTDDLIVVSKDVDINSIIPQAPGADLRFNPLDRETDPLAAMTLQEEACGSGKAGKPSFQSILASGKPKIMEVGKGAPDTLQAFTTASCSKAGGSAKGATPKAGAKNIPGGGQCPAPSSSPQSQVNGRAAIQSAFHCNSGESGNDVPQQKQILIADSRLMAGGSKSSGKTEKKELYEDNGGYWERKTTCEGGTCTTTEENITRKEYEKRGGLPLDGPPKTPQSGSGSGTGSASPTPGAGDNGGDVAGADGSDSCEDDLCVDAGNSTPAPEKETGGSNLHKPKNSGIDPYKNPSGGDDINDTGGNTDRPKTSGIDPLINPGGGDRDQGSIFYRPCGVAPANHNTPACDPRKSRDGGGMGCDDRPPPPPRPRGAGGPGNPRAEGK